MYEIEYFSAAQTNIHSHTCWFDLLTRAALHTLTLLLCETYNAAAGKAIACLLLKPSSSSWKLTCLTYTTDVLAVTRTYAGRNTVQRAVPQLQSTCNDKMLCTEDKATVTCEVCVRRAPKFHDCHGHALILQQQAAGSRQQYSI